MTQMITLYCIVHRQDAKWMIGQKLSQENNHAIYHKLYDLDNVRDALQADTAMVCLKITENTEFEAFNPFIPA